MPFGMWTRVGPRKHVLDERAHWRHLANTIEPSMCGGDAAFLSNYFNHSLVLSLSLYYSTQWTAEGSVFLAPSVCVFFLCVWNISGAAECICAKFTRKTREFGASSLGWVWRSRSRSKVKVTRDKNGIFRFFRRPAYGLSCVKHVWPLVAFWFLYLFCKHTGYIALGLMVVVITGSPLVIEVEDTKDSKPKDGRRWSV